MNNLSSGSATAPSNLRTFPIARALRFGGLALLTALAGCQALPEAGPEVRQVHAQSRRDPQPFSLIDVDGAALSALHLRNDPSLALSFGDQAAPGEPHIAVGDALTLSIWEAGSENLFSSAALPAASAGTGAGGSHPATIPEQIVSADGSITVPFAGRVRVAGITPTEAQRRIEGALAGKAAKPQVLVSSSRSASTAVTVIGDATAGARVPLSAHGDRLLDVMAAAGGLRVPSFETRVQLTRNGRTTALPLTRVLNDPRENIYLRPGDNLVLTRHPDSFTAFGATGRNAQISFDAPRVSLAEAVAKSGGLLDQRADAAGVYLFRYEAPIVAAKLGAPIPRGALAVPVVYRVDLTQAAGYFLAQGFEMRDQDILFVANAATNKLEKFLILVGLISQPITAGALVSNSLK